MNLSLGEFRALAAKAFRGAGYTWGLADDAAFAAKRLAGWGLPADKIAVRLLRVVDGIPMADVAPDRDWRASSGVLCPVCLGVAISDLGSLGVTDTGPVAEPILLAPFLSMLCDDTAAGFEAEWSGGRFTVGANGFSGDTGVVVSEPVSLRLAPGEPVRSNRPKSMRIDVADQTLRALEGFAHRTYAPATDASRESGAGAGLTDTD